MKRSCLVGAGLQLLLSAALLWSPTLWGQTVKLPAEPAAGLRDPTLAPMQPAATGTGSPDAGAIGAGGFSIMVVNGRPHVIIGTRLYAQGQKLGEARIERISETEVWLREGGQLRKIPLFAGIERRSVSPACAASAPRGAKTSRSSTTSPQAKPCVDAQP